MTSSANAAVGHVSLLGAGPGDPELITVRGLRRLGEADVVLYDALVHPDLLRHVRPGAELVFVGKRGGRASERQSQINERLIAFAKQGKRTVRLKGGDPYLFGRGSEEAEALVAAQVPFDVVPGVASPMAASAFTGISLTHRDLASSVAYLTATESVEKDESAHDWDKLATATQTLVIFMGLRKLGSLMERLAAHGRPSDTPVAVVSCASLPSQRTVVGTVATIASLVEAARLEMPALTIVGHVVGLRDQLDWFERLPLFGKRVLVTRPEGQADALCSALRDRGAEPIALPTIQIAAPVDGAPLVRAAAEAHLYDWVVFTSVNGVAAFFQALAGAGRDTRALGRARIAAIGPATREALLRHGLRADAVPDEYRGEAVFGAIVRVTPSLAGLRVLLPRAAVAREVLPDLLRDAGASVDVVPAYQSVDPAPQHFEQVRELLSEGGLDYLTFTSPSTVQKLHAALGADATALLGRARIACIGPITAAAVRGLGLPVHVEASTYTADGLVAALTADAHARAPGTARA
jgi:uroporphyrinogen III methyltransferase / synthase